MVFLLIVRMLREELQLLQEQGSYVGEVVKPMDKKKVLVKVSICQQSSLSKLVTGEHCTSIPRIVVKIHELHSILNLRDSTIVVVKWY